MWEVEKATWPHHASSRFVTAGGLRWHVQQMGAGPWVLLVHGTGASTHTWRDVMPLLAAQYGVLAVDLPGHGFTGAVQTGAVPTSTVHAGTVHAGTVHAGVVQTGTVQRDAVPTGAVPKSAVQGAGCSIGGMSTGLAALLNELRIAPTYCVGHSAGAVVLCRMALDGHVAPRVIASINGAFLPLKGAAGLLFSPMARFVAGNSLLPKVLAWHAGNSASVARTIAGTGSHIGAAGVDLYTRLLRNPQHVAGALCMMANWDLYAFERELPRLSSPLALLVGENDRTVPPRQATVVKQRVAHADIHSLGRLGHLAHEEAPTLVAAELLRIFGSPDEETHMNHHA